MFRHRITDIKKRELEKRKPDNKSEPSTLASTIDPRQQMNLM